MGTEKEAWEKIEADIAALEEKVKAYYGRLPSGAIVMSLHLREAMAVADIINRLGPVLDFPYKIKELPFDPPGYERVKSAVMELSMGNHELTFFERPSIDYVAIRALAVEAEPMVIRDTKSKATFKAGHNSARNRVIQKEAYTTKRK